tara:strand:- start:1271 stop:2929 length:1659 start_codon:yes stop_codon:yes gene_type:complete
MALSIKLNTYTQVDANHTVSTVAGSSPEVLTVATTTNHTLKTNFTFAPNTNVQVTVATITFTASSDYYYYKEPRFKIKSPFKSSYSIAETVTRDSIGRVTAKQFVVKYTNTVNSSGDIVIFNHETKALPATKNTINLQDLVEIKSFDVDTENIVSTGGTRFFTVKGDKNASFNLKVTKANGASADTTYDFTSATFTSTVTELSNQTLGSLGQYSDKIAIPAVTADETYTIELSPSLSLGTTLNATVQDSLNKLKNTKTLNQFKGVTITLTLASTSNSNHYNTLPSDITFVGEKNSQNRVDKKVSFDLSLSANSFTFARGYTTLEGAISDIDFRSSIAKVKNGNQSAGVVVVLDDVNNLAPGMSMTGTGVTGSPRILSINTVNKSITVSVTQDAQGSGGMADNAALTFTYGGSSTSRVISGCDFDLKDLDQSTGFIVNAATLSPVETAVNGAVSNSKIVNIDSENGIKAAATTFVSGLGVDATVVAPHVDANTHQSTDHRLLLSANQTLADNTPLVFTGSSRSANITFNFAVIDFGTKDHTITLNLDTILTVS